MTSGRGDALILAAALIWGVAFYFQKTAMEDIGPLLFTGLRGLIAAIVLFPLMLREQRTSDTAARDMMPFAVGGGLVFFSAGAIQQTGLITATVINTGLLTSLYVVATPMLYWLFERRRPSNAIWLASLIAFVGVWMLSGGSLSALSTGDWLVVGAVIFWSAHMIVAGRSGRLARPATFTCFEFSIVALLGISGALLFETFTLQDIANALDAILYVGVLSTALTFTLMAIALQYMPAPRATVLLSAEVLFSCAAGYVLLGERLSLLGWTGAALIIAAVLLVRIRAEAPTDASTP